MNESTKCTTRLIEDLPAEQDSLAFHGDIGPHQRVAKAIAEVIRSKHEPGGKMIGLEGGWGAGKTTVVKLLANELATEKNISLHVFDAWAHEGDPLRRTFLESLIRHIQGLEWVEKSTWDKAIDVLAKRRKTTSTRTIPKTTRLGKCFAISLLLVPLGSTLFAKGITTDPTLAISWLFPIGTLLSLAPFLVLLGNWIRVTCRPRQSKDKGEASFNEDVEVGNWAFLSGEAITNLVQESNETPDPTSIEFEENFRNLMREALPGGSERQAVIVLDNLDRVNPDDALTIWSTLQTFLQDRHAQSEEWYQNVWIIVPYDPKGLRRLWDNRVVKSANGDDTDTTIVQAVSRSFIDKSFQLRFEVPPPVLSNWKAYLIGLVEEALPGHKGADAHTIYRVLNRCRQRDESPTPRELKLYVNQIGVIHRQWEHEFPVGHVAYYVLLRRQGIDIRKQLLEGKLPDATLEALLAEGLRENLAGLAFNVPAALGQQLLLSEPIFDAFTQSTAEDIQRLIEGHQDGFWAVLEESVSDKLSDAEPAALGRVGQNLEDAEIKKNSEREEYRSFVHALKEAVSNVKKWAPLDKELAHGACAVARVVDDVKCTEQIIKGVKTSLTDTKEKEASTSASKDTIDALVIVASEISALKSDVLPKQGFTLPVDAEGWIASCILIAQLDETSQLTPMIRPSCKVEEIETVLSQQITNGKATREILDAVAVTQQSPLKPAWTEVVKAAELRMNAAQNAQGEEAARLLQLLSVLRQYGTAETDSATQRLVDQGHLAHCNHHGPSQKSNLFKGWCLATYARYLPGFEKPTTVGNSDAGISQITSALQTDDEKLATAFVSACRTDKNIDVLWRIIDKKGYEPLLVRSLKLVADGNAPQDTFTVEEIVARWDDLHSQLSDETDTDRFETLIQRLSGDHELPSQIQQRGEGFEPDNAGLYLSIVVGVPSAVEFTNWCCDCLKSVQTDQWQRALKEENDLADLLSHLVQSGITLDIGHDLQDAVVEHAKSVLDGTVNPSKEIQGVRPSLVASLDSDASRATLRNRLLDEAIARDGECSDGFFNMYGEEIKGRETLARNDRTVEKLYSALVRTKKQAGLVWLADVAEMHVDLLDAVSDKTAIRDFRGRVAEELLEEHSEPKVTDSIGRIAKAWRIQPLSKEEDEGEMEDGDSDDNE